MTNKTKTAYHISGHVIEHGTEQGIPGLRVEVWDRDITYDVMVGKSTTDTQGKFHLRLGKADCQEFYLDDHPHLFFRVFFEDELLEHTEHLTLWRDLKAGKNRFTIRIEDVPV